MIRHIALTNYTFMNEKERVFRGDIFDTIGSHQEKVYKKVFAPFDTLKEVNVLEIENGDKYIIGKGVVACVLTSGQCSVVRSPLFSFDDIKALIQIAHYKAINNIK